MLGQSQWDFTDYSVTILCPSKVSELSLKVSKISLETSQLFLGPASEIYLISVGILLSFIFFQ